MMATVDHPVRLKRGNSTDLDGVMEVMRAAFGDRYGEAWTRSQCAGILPMAGVSLTLATDDGAIVGFSLVRSVTDESELLLLGVLPTHQRRGVGTRLLEEFVESAATEGVNKVHLEVRDGNPAVEMYRTAGFDPVGRRRNYYRGSNGRQFDALTFAREL